ncbi:hypothetical protein QJS10_CPB22g01235 [Acorus calamus]|uniref:IQ domain-containing protein IQM2-like n=1 Tax=Acorus calamus TaxID=4465 RepID=A0AAV9BZY4_ACOCL|nr:hypothetical protein QJS10_CPB22g01235 [Acorus calamus]
MGQSFSSPGADDASLKENVDEVVARSISFKGQDTEPTIVKTLSGKMIIGGSVSFKSTESDPFQMETTISISLPNSDKTFVKTISFKSGESGRMKVDSPKEIVQEPPVLEVSGDLSTEPIQKSQLGDPTSHEAAVKLQKVYKSFRTRRKLADCAVLVEQRWWKLLDFAMLNQSSVSFFDHRPETAFSRWSRAMTRVAKVGKGLSKDDKAQKLALQHWLEAIDSRHRYGHNLHFYYDHWLHCDSRQPFFYWLDVGEGKEVNLEEQCPRSKLQRQSIKYLDPKEREAYEVIIEDGKLIYKQTGELMDTTSQGQKQSKWIFVLSTSKKLYVGQKKKGKFQHSSFLAGGATSAAGRLVVENGILKAVWPHSGHYRPTEENFQEFLNFLNENSVDLTDIKRNPTDEDEESTLSSNSSKLNLTRINTDQNQPHSFQTRRPHKIEVPTKLNAFEMAKCDHSPEPNYVSHKRNLFEEDHEEHREVAVTPDVILNRINSMKGMKSYQLGKQLSCKWTTGAGPRIGCVRDYPSEIQFHALEQVNLSLRNPASLSLKALPLSQLKENNNLGASRGQS